MDSHFTAYLYRLRHIERWSLMRNTTRENVAEHSYHVALLSHMLCEIGNRLYGKSLDAERAATIALFHDASEVFTGDIPTPVKHHNPKMLASFRELEAMAGERLLGMVPPPLREVYAPLVGGPHAPEGGSGRSGADGPAGAARQSALREDAASAGGARPAADGSAGPGARSTPDAPTGFDLRSAAGGSAGPDDRSTPDAPTGFDLHSAVGGSAGPDDHSTPDAPTGFDLHSAAGGSAGPGAHSGGNRSSGPDSELLKMVKAADLLDAYIKCLSELSSGNREFAVAKGQTEQALEALGMPEVDWFLRHMAPSFSMTLDELSAGEQTMD